jgi:hypothetical protein
MGMYQRCINPPSTGRSAAVHLVLHSSRSPQPDGLCNTEQHQEIPSEQALFRFGSRGSGVRVSPSRRLLQADVPGDRLRRFNGRDLPPAEAYFRARSGQLGAMWAAGGVLPRPRAGRTRGHRRRLPRYCRWSCWSRTGRVASPQDRCGKCAGFPCSSSRHW